MTLPAEVIPQRTKAEYKNGILEITLQKKTSGRVKSKGFSIEVK